MSKQSEEQYEQQLRQAMAESMKIFKEGKDDGEVSETSDKKTKTGKVVVIKEGHTVIPDDVRQERQEKRKGLYVEYLEEELDRLRDKLKEVYLAVDELQTKNSILHDELFGHISTNFMRHSFPDYTYPTSPSPDFSLDDAVMEPIKEESDEQENDESS